MFFGSSKVLSEVQQILGRNNGGIFKRIDENREILEVLRRDTPNFREKMWLESKLKSQDEFLCELAAQVPLNDVQFPPTPNDHPGRRFPRQWSDRDELVNDPIKSNQSHEKTTLVTRYKTSSTSANLTALLTLIRDENCKEIRLFASPDTATGEFSDSDGPITNLPLVAALVKYVIPEIEDVYVLFDGLFLTAARRPRFGEVQQLLDVAQASGKTLFSTVRAPFTSSMNPGQAAQVLLALAPAVALTAASRPQYFGLLCSIPESQYP